MLLEIEGGQVRVFTGLAMRMRLMQVLGPVRAWRVAQAVARMGGPVLGVDWGRRRFLGRALGALAGLLLMRHAGQAAAAPPPPTSGGLPIRRSRRLEGTERAQALQHLQNHPDLKAMGLTVPPDDGEFPLVIAHELADGHTLLTAGWRIAGPEIAIALLAARTVEVSLSQGSAVQVKSLGIRLRVERASTQLVDFSLNGKQVHWSADAQGIRTQETCDGCANPWGNWLQFVCQCTAWDNGCLIRCGAGVLPCSVACGQCIITGNPWACASCIACALAILICSSTCCTAMQCGCGTCPPGP
jgi:nitrogen fixation protein